MTDSFWGNYGQGLSAITGFGQQRTQQRAGSQIVQGDRRGAANTLLQSGDIPTGLALEEQAVEQDVAAKAKQLDFTLQAARALRQARESGQDVLAAYDGMAPAFQQMGTDPAQIAQMREALGANPDQFLQSVEQIVGQQQRELSFQKAGDRLLVFEANNPDPVRTFEAPARPIEVGGVLVDPVTFAPIVDTREPKTVTVQNSDGSSSIVQIDQPAPVAAVRGGVDAIEVIQTLIPGARFTSGLRTTDQNRSAGGAPNSFHLRGQAVDIAPPAGVSLQDFRRQLESQGVAVKELLDEGDHWHIAWEGGSAAPNIGRGEPVRRGDGVRVVASGADRGPTPAQARAEARDARMTDRQSRQDSRALRREFEALPDVKDYRTVESAFRQVERLSQNSGNPADDVALTFSFMKMLDPGSVVREGEYALVGRAQGLTGRALVALQRIDSGEALTPELRADLRETAQRVLEGRRSRYDALVNQYRGYAEEDGFDPNRIVPDQPRAQDGPRVRFEPSPQQRQWYQQYGRPQARNPVGSRGNPRLINPADPRTSYGNVPSGQYFVTPDGQLRGPKP